MSLEGAAVSLGATIVSVAFAALVFNQWIARRKPYQLAWSLGLGLYGAAAFLQFLAEAYGWSVATYKVYYLIAALLVAVLGIGSTFLLHRRAGVGFALYTVVVFIGFAIAVAGAAVNMSALAATVPAAGAVALVGIAAYSFWRTRLRFNLWIAIGALINAAGGSLARYNITWALYIGELIGIAVMFWGFLASQDLAKARAPVARQIPS